MRLRPEEEGDDPRFYRLTEVDDREPVDGNFWRGVAISLLVMTPVWMLIFWLILKV